MTPLVALLDLLARLEASHGAAGLVSEEELSHWPVEAVNALKKLSLLVRASPSVSVVCPGCEQQCTMPVHTVPSGNAGTTSFVVCDKRDDINRVVVPAERLRQWRCGAEAVCEFVAHRLGLQPNSNRKTDAGVWEFGLVKGKRRSQMVSLRASEALELVVGQNAVPLTELVRFGEGGYSVDREAIRQLVDASTVGDPRYTPSTVRREASKLDTQDLYEQWRKEFRALKERRPGLSVSRYAEMISKTDAASGRDAETIRKQLTRRK